MSLRYRILELWKSCEKLLPLTFLRRKVRFHILRGIMPPLSLILKKYSVYYMISFGTFAIILL